MKRCIKCDFLFNNENWSCANCGWEPQIDAGVVKFANHIDGANDSYDPSWFPLIAEIEERHFWFKSRNRMLQWLFERHLLRVEKYIEIGCGTGNVMRMVAERFPDWSLDASEAHEEGLQLVKKRIKRIQNAFQIDACEIPFREHYDAVGAFDVIEHIEDDIKALREINGSLNMGGHFVVSVPQHMLLWSIYDEIGCHYRRYNRGELEQKLKSNGFEIVDSISFVTLLFPLMLLSRALNTKENKSYNLMDEFKISSFLNVLLGLVMRFEFALVTLGFRMPFGGSRMIVAKKTKNLAA